MASASTLPLQPFTTPTGRTGRIQDEDVTFANMVERYQRVVFAVALRVVRNREDAEDVVQEVWLRASRGLAGLRDHGRLLPWLCSISHNCALNAISAGGDWHRAISCDIDVDPASLIPAPADEGPEQRAIADDDRAQVLAAMMTLPARDRRILILRDLRCLPYAEISKMLDISTGNAEVSVFRARARLRSRMGGPHGA